MKRPILLFTFFAAFSCFAPAQHELRTFTNAQGKAVQARLVAVDGTMVKIALANGTPYTLPIASFSTADQEYFKTAATATFKGVDQLQPAVLNELVGQPLFGDASLWQTKAEEVAQRLQWPKESETKANSSYRDYPKDDYRLFGARPWSVAMYAADGMVTNLSLVYANKGDLFGMNGENNNRVDRDTPEPQAMAILKKKMKEDVDAITAKLTEKLGEPQKQRFGEGEGRDNMLRWDWRGHTILLREKEAEYVGLELVTKAFADAGGKVERTSDDAIRDRAKANVVTRPNGDVVIEDIPMVDQGPKGYCVPATAERAMRYLSVPADMYVLAMAGETNLGGGTSVQKLLQGVRSDISRKGRSFDSWDGELELKKLQRYIDKGLPVIWALNSTDEFNKLANDRTKARKETADFKQWKDKLPGLLDKSLVADREQGHVVLIVGYNKETNEFAFSDSWGEDYKERWITFEEAENVSQKAFWVVGF